MSDTNLCDINNPDDKQSENLLPPRPREPVSSECCGNGCSPCVYDIYEQDLSRWQQQCARIRNDEQPTDSSPVSGMCKEEYREFELTSMQRESEHCFLYRFSLPDDCSLRANAGQHLILRWQNGSVSMTRPYTPISPAAASGYFEVIIKLYPGGVMSHYVRTWTVGERVSWRGPYGQFTYQPNKHRRLLMLAAGVGVLPMLQVIAAVLADAEDETRLQLVYAVRRHGDVVRKAALLDGWQDYWNFSLLYVVSELSASSCAAAAAAAAGRCHHDRVHRGRLTPALLAALLAPDGAASTRALVCGTSSFERDVTGQLAALGVTPTDVHRFG